LIDQPVPSPQGDIRRRLWLPISLHLIFAGFIPCGFAMAAVDPKTLPITSDLAKRLKAHVDFLAGPDLAGRKPGTPGHRKAAAYIEARFQEAGLAPLASLKGYRQSVSTALGDNLLGRHPSTPPDPASRWIVIGAHYDHLGGRYLGADDNASAVAILIETARILPPLRAHWALFAAFNTEEPPYIRTSLMGSQHFVDHLPAEIGAPSDIQAAVIMDLMGGVHWEPLRETIFAAGAEKSPELYARLKQASRPQVRGARLEAVASTLSPLVSGHPPLTVLPVGLHLVEEIPLLGQVAFSDYDAFRNARVPFLFLSAGRTPRYHQPSDLPDTLHYERMAATVAWLQDLVQLIDQDQGPYGFDNDRLVFGDELASLRPLLALAADEQSKIPGTSALSLWKLKRDLEWLERVNPDKPSKDDIARLERISIRLQCLLADFPGCFLL
jgi:hypothetical protein